MSRFEITMRGRKKLLDIKANPESMGLKIEETILSHLANLTGSLGATKNEIISFNDRFSPNSSREKKMAGTAFDSLRRGGFISKVSKKPPIRKVLTDKGKFI